MEKLESDTLKQKRRLFLRDLAKGDPLWFLFKDAGEICFKSGTKWLVPVTLEDVMAVKVKLRKKYHKEGVTDEEL